MSNELQIPLSKLGTKTYFDSYRPSEQELRECPHVQMNSSQPWNPQSVSLGETSAEKKIPFGIYIGQTQRYLYHDPTEDDALLHTTGAWLHNRYIDQVDGFGYDIPDLRSTISLERHEEATAKVLSERFRIGIRQAKAVLKATTQKRFDQQPCR